LKTTSVAALGAVTEGMLMVGLVDQLPGTDQLLLILPRQYNCPQLSMLIKKDEIRKSK
jgi:hypothetical protein